MAHSATAGPRPGCERRAGLLLSCGRAESSGPRRRRRSLAGTLPGSELCCCFLRRKRPQGGALPSPASPGGTRSALTLDVKGRLGLLKPPVASTAPRHLCPEPRSAGSTQWGSSQTRSPPLRCGVCGAVLGPRGLPPFHPWTMPSPAPLQWPCPVGPAIPRGTRLPHTGLASTPGFLSWRGPEDSAGPLC